MKSKILILFIFLFSFSTPAFASWSVYYDNAGGSAWQSSFGSSPNNVLFRNGGVPPWNFLNSVVTGQTALDDAYALDPSSLPNISGPNAVSDSLTWHCGWSQFSSACPPPTPPGPVSPPLALNPLFQYLNASSSCTQNNASGSPTSYFCTGTSTFPLYPGYGDWVLMESLILFCVAFIPVATFYSMFTLKKKSKK